MSDCCDCPECGTTHGWPHVDDSSCDICEWECAICARMFCNSDGLSMMGPEDEPDAYDVCEPCQDKARSENGWVEANEVDA